MCLGNTMLLAGSPGLYSHSKGHKMANFDVIWNCTAQGICKPNKKTYHAYQKFVQDLQTDI